jgi:hypothetical protein
MKNLIGCLAAVFMLLAFDPSTARAAAKEVHLHKGDSVTLNGTTVSCERPDQGGTCNAYGCSSCGTCNSYGCPRCDSGHSGGSCNAYGCWDGARGECNSYGCSDNGKCNAYGCSENGECNAYGCP